jgi:hypothetical protein
MKRNTKTIKGSTFFLESKIDSEFFLPLTKNSEEEIPGPVQNN